MPNKLFVGYALDPSMYEAGLSRSYVQVYPDGRIEIWNGVTVLVSLSCWEASELSSILLDNEVSATITKAVKKGLRQT